MYGEISISSREEGEQFIRNEIKDSGLGMNPEKLESLFDITCHHTSYGTSGEKGSGLGLLLFKEIVGKSGGKLEVESAPGKGSSFYITLPKNKN